MSLSEIIDAISNFEFSKAEQLIAELPDDLKLTGRILQLKMDSIKSKAYTPILNELLELDNYAKKTNNKQMEILALLVIYNFKSFKKGFEYTVEERQQDIVKLHEKLNASKDVIDSYIYFDTIITIGYSLFENTSLDEKPPNAKIIQYFEVYKGNSKLTQVQSARIYAILGKAYYEIGFLNKALENIEKAIQLSEKYLWNKKQLISILVDLGNFKEALRIIYELKEEYQKKGNKPDLGILAENELDCYLWMNDFDQFIETQKKYQDYFNQILSMGERQNTRSNPEMRTSTLAKYYMVKAEYEIAEEIFLEYIDYVLKEGSQVTPFLVLHYFYVAQCNVKMNRLDKAKKYLTIMQDLRLQEGENQFFLQYCQKVEADLFFAKRDLESLFLAKQIYEQIINAPFLWFNIYYPSIYNLLEILFSEYYVTKNDILITRIWDLFTWTKADLENKSYHVQLVKFLILETKWHILNHDVSNAFQSLEQGFKLADTYGYVELSKVIMRIYQFIQTRIDASGDLAYKMMELDSLFDITRNEDMEEFKENNELMTYSSQLLGLKETPEALLIISDIHNIEHQYYFDTNAQMEIKALMNDLFDKMETNKQLIRPLSSFERHQIGQKQYLYLNDANYHLLYFYTGNFYQAARKFSHFQDFMYSQKIEMLKVDSSVFSNYIYELFQFSDDGEIIIDKTISRITNEFETIIHPIRLAVVKLLVLYIELTRNTLIKKIQVPTSSLDRNIKKLIEENLVAKEYRFIDSQTEAVYTITTAGNLLYNRLKAALG